ncbi:MAG: glucosaminidase domain-containing protein, partial [Chloroflexota bacterium]|nr:glucosaminidase domain-containing protein [Chloroflexota bacterium]
MGRAAAVAYATVEQEEELFGAEGGQSGPYRLLGEQELLYVLAPRSRPALIEEQHYAQPQYVQYGEYEPEPDFSSLFPLAYEPYPVYEPEYAPGVVRSRQVRNGILAAILAVVMIVMLVLAGPVLAREGSRGLRLSGYRDVVPGTVAGVGVQDVAPIIDTTTGAVPAEQAAPPAQAEAPAGAYDVMGAPTISVEQIEKVLRQYGSPVAGLGQTLYDLGIKYGINPAYALAFFVHESGCGTKGVARFSKSLGNIRWTEGYTSYEGYRSYPSWEAGMEDWYLLIKDLYINGWGLRTVDAIVPVYAPAADRNDPVGYIASVKY